MRTFHIGGVATRGVEEKDVKAKRDGKVKFVGLNIVINDEGKKIALSRNGEIQILDPKGRELEKYDVPDGADHDGRGRPADHPRPDARASGTRTTSRSWPRSAARSASTTSSRTRR